MEQSFLERCALHYHQQNDTNNMMKFIEAFNSLDMVRTFLRSGDYLDELVLFEARSENFMEAATIARLKGDRLLEADMLEKAGRLVDAAEVILFYVLGSSLWANGNKGWPLKTFPDKEKLLAKVRLMAKSKDDMFYEFIISEATILSNTNIPLSEMKDCLIASQRLENLRGEIICLRKIIDYHLHLAPSEYFWVDDVVLNTVEHVEDSIYKNRVSIETLTYFWNLWKEKVVNIMNYLNSQGTQVKQDYKSYENFCLGYLGVYKQEHNQSSIYVLLNSDAYWRKEIEDRFLQNTRGLLGMSYHQFASSARSYWFSTLLNLCMQVLEKLKSLGITALNRYQVAKSVIECKILDKKLPGELLKCWKHSRERFSLIFSLRDPKLMMFKRMMNLRLTELSKDLIKEFTIELMSKNGRSKHMEMWTVVMLVFIFGNLSEELYQVIRHRSDLSPTYKAFIKQLKESKISGLVSISLVSNFEKSLQEEAFSYNRVEDSSDCMPPSWFVYFLDRLLFLVSSWHGSFFTVRSSIRETIPWGNLRCNSSSLSVADSKYFSKRSFDSIASKIKNILSIGYLGYFNLCEYWMSLDLLYNLLSRYDIITVLPLTFVKILKKRGTRPFDKLLAESLDTIGDPLVCLRSGDIQREQLSHNVLEIDVDLIHSREDLLGILYPENSECDRNCEMENCCSNFDGNVCFSNFDHTSCTECEIESDDDIPDYDTERAELEIDYENFNVGSFAHLFQNTVRVYMYSKKITGGVGSFNVCKPQMKVCFMAHFLFIFLFQ
ncbi:hypothetical protein MKX03_030490 [Papaver bracteatum]|nr:hypothetical protein MKX03_030490 [Papaver bracteatum]